MSPLSLSLCWTSGPQDIRWLHDIHGTELWSNKVRLLLIGSSLQPAHCNHISSASGHFGPSENDIKQEFYRSLFAWVQLWAV